MINCSKNLPLQLSVIIVNYNVKFFLEQCLYSLLKAIKDIKSEILVIDNASTDGSKEYLTEKFPQVQFTWLDSNLGFGKANNLALQKAKSDYVLFLNPDTLLAEDCLNKCLEYMKANERCAALGVRMIDGNGNFLKESKRGFPTLSNSFFKFSGLCKLFPRSKTFSGYYLGHIPENKSGRVEVLAGAFMMISRKAIEITQGFDERFFMYGEDVDLSYRVHLAGMENHYFAGTTIVHFKGESTQKFSKSYTRHFYNAMHIYVNKHQHSNKITRALLHASITAGQCIAHMKFALRKLWLEPAVNKNTNAVIEASQPEFNALLHLLKFARQPIIVCGRIANNETDTEANIGRWENIKALVTQKKINRIIFCEGTHSFKTIVEKMQDARGLAGFLFHAYGSSSIVGSNNKNSNGLVIFKN